MTGPTLRAMDAGPTTAPAWTAGIAAALDGSGPALLPLPDGPGAVRSELLAAMRPEDPRAPLEAPGIALVVPTSGSTGGPKGALLAAAAVQASATAAAQRLDGPGRWVLALPLTHVAGLMVVVRALLAGTEPVPVPPGPGSGFDPVRFAEATAEAAHRCARDGLPLYTSLVPTQLHHLLDSGTDLRAYDALLVGAAAAPASLLDRASAAGARVVTTYGMSETCGGCVYDGQPLAGVDAVVDGDGAVLLGGPTLFAGYRLRPDLTAAALDPLGRLRTGDLGRLRDGRLEVLGRVDDLIVSGGVNVVPGRVEQVLAAGGPRDAAGAARVWAVVGVPDPVWGQRVIAVVAAPQGSELPGLDALRAAAADQLPAAWLPSGLVRVDALPLLATGKVDRVALRAVAQARREP